MVRLASSGDEPAIADYLRQAMEMTVAEDLGFIPTACPSIIAALERGQEGFLAALARVVVEGESDGPAACRVWSPRISPVRLSARAPAALYVIGQAINAGLRSQAPMTELQGLMGISKLVGVAERRDTRRFGVGTELVRIAEQIIRR